MLKNGGAHVVKRKITAAKAVSLLLGAVLTMALCGCGKEAVPEQKPVNAVQEEPTGAPQISQDETEPEDFSSKTETDGGNEATDPNGGTEIESGTPKITPEISLSEVVLQSVRETGADVVDTTKVPYTYTEMCEDLLLLEQLYPEIISVDWAGYSVDHRPIPAVKFGNPDAEQTVFVQASIHARESLTTLLVMKQLEQYAREYDTGSCGGRSYREIFSGVSLFVVPMTNPDGVSVSQLGPESIRNAELRALVESFYERDGKGLDRSYFFSRYKANANGVDLNRNFAYGWDEYIGVPGPAADHYKGEAPASEPETKLLIELTKSSEAVAAVSYHATGSVLYWDFGQTGEIRERCLSLVNLVQNLTGYRISYAATDRQDEAGYCEWAVGIHGIPEVTIEVGTVAAPLPISEFRGVWEHNREVLAAIAYKYLVEAKRSEYLQK